MPLADNSRQLFAHRGLMSDPIGGLRQPARKTA
jgi:hypothetical protein